MLGLPCGPVAKTPCSQCRRHGFDPWSGDYPCGLAGKESTCNTGDLGSIPGLGRSPGEGNGYLPTLVFWPGEFHGWRTLAGYSPWGLKESDRTELLSLFNLHIMCFPGGISGKEPACSCRRCKRHSFDPWVEKIPWRRKWQPTLVFLSGKSHGQRSLVAYSPWGCKRVVHDLATKQTIDSLSLSPVSGTAHSRFLINVL